MNGRSKIVKKSNNVLENSRIFKGIQPSVESRPEAFAKSQQPE